MCDFCLYVSKYFLLLFVSNKINWAVPNWRTHHWDLGNRNLYESRSNRGNIS